MLEMMIVDDFFYDREEAKDILDWKSLSINIVAAVENGSLALKLISGSIPDIILTDIEMPEMDGMELTKIIKNRYPSIKVVFMSCYHDFEYARRALKLDVEAYITKPLIREEVAEVFCKVCSRICEERERKDQQKRLKENFPLIREQFLRSIILGIHSESEKLWEHIRYLEIPIVDGGFQLIVFDGAKCEERDSFYKILLNTIKDAKDSVEFRGKSVLIKVDTSYFALLLSRSLEGNIMSDVNLILAGEIKRILNDYGLPGVSVILGESFTDIMKINQQYLFCLHAAKQNSFFNSDQLLVLKDIPHEYKIMSIDPDRLKQDIRDSLFSLKTESISVMITRYFNQNLKNHSRESVKNLVYSMVICAQLLMAEINLDFDEISDIEISIWDRIEGFKTIEQIRQRLTCFFEAIRKSIIEEKNNSRNKRFINAVGKYIEEHIDKELTVKNIAGEIFLSPNYLNFLFKNTTGETIPVYVKKIRVEKAKELLKDTKFKLYEIADMVGYRHLPHFNSVFRKYTGMTLKEYRDCV